MLIILVGALLVAVSLRFTHDMAQKLRIKEQHDVELWARVMERVSYGSGIGDVMSGNDPLLDNIVDSHNNIPFIITDENLNPLKWHLVPREVIDHPEEMRQLLVEMADINAPIRVEYNRWGGGHYHLIFYGRSSLLKSLYYFPYIQICAIIVFILFGFIAFRFSKRDEQNRVWIGLAKETAHQLGTPTSSLLGWLEYLRGQNVDPMAVDEMSKDLAHLMKIVDRFSKIGSETPLMPANINEVVGESVMYFRKRIPRNVTLDYNGLAMAPLRANINAALFEWVVENLMKNSLDALQGRGSIQVTISGDEKRVIIDVKDTGKGIAKANWKRIFEPGFTTKTRGWGLGLSLSRRVIEDYHHGKIAVLESEIGKGTTIRVTIKRLFD